MDRIRILSVEDDGDFERLIQKTLAVEKDFEVAGSCGNGEDALKMAMELAPDIVLMDLNLGSGARDGVLAARQIRLRTDAKVIFLSVYDDPEIIVPACREAFASGYVLKTQFPLLTPTIRQISQGPTPQSHLICDAILSVLSPAEKSVLYWMAGVKGVPNSSAKTIANQQTSVLHKLGLKNKSAAAHIFAAYFQKK